MNSVRLWIALLALVCFAAGWAAGLGSAPRLEPFSRESGPFAEYEELLSQTFELSAERRAALVQVLGLYARDVDRVRERYLARAGSEMESELAETGLRYGDWIRNHVVPETERQRFDQLALARPFSSTR